MKHSNPSTDVADTPNYLHNQSIPIYHPDLSTFLSQQLCRRLVDGGMCWVSLVSSENVCFCGKNNIFIFYFVHVQESVNFAVRLENLTEGRIFLIKLDFMYF